MELITCNRKYASNYTYDANGNILSLIRNDETGSPMDNLTYSYHHTDFETSPGAWDGEKSNRLLAAEDAISNGTGGDDIKPGQNFDGANLSLNNYGYDEIGNLIKDDQENIEEIDWTVAGKVKSITRKSEPWVN